MTKNMSPARKALWAKRDGEWNLPENSRPIYTNRKSSHAAAWAIVDRMMDELVDIRPPQRKNVEKHRANLLVLLLDLYMARLQGQHLWLGFPGKTENQYTAHFTDHGLSGGIIAKQIRELERLDYVSVMPGFKDLVTGQGFQSRVQATSRLFDFCIQHGLDACMVGNDDTTPVKLRAWVRDGMGKKKRIDLALPKTPAVKRMVADMETVNAVVGPADIGLDMPEDFRRQVYADMKWTDQVDPTKNGLTTFYRSFIGDMTHGGRLFGHWCHGLPSECRKYITIDGEPTWELDYGSFHITLLYDLDNIPRPEGDDMYWYPGCDEKDEARDIRKLILQIVINAKTLGIAYEGARREIREGFGIDMDKDEVKAIAKGLMKHHYRIKKAFGSGIGTHLQFKDSEIMMGILLDLAADGIPALPVHDSCIVARRHEARLRELMVKHYRLHTHDGCTPTIDRKGRDIDFP